MHPITKMAVKWPMGRRVCSVDVMDKDMIHMSGGTEQVGVRFRCAAQNGKQFNI